MDTDIFYLFYFSLHHESGVVFPETLSLGIQRFMFGDVGNQFFLSHDALVAGDLISSSVAGVFQGFVVVD